jgi:nicotinamide mononucleotide (NMN) deamidase PncC
MTGLGQPTDAMQLPQPGAARFLHWAVFTYLSCTKIEMATVRYKYLKAFGAIDGGPT